MDQRRGKVTVDIHGRMDATEVHVPSNCVGWVTGNRGSELRRIEQESGTFCFVGLNMDGEERLLVFSHEEGSRTSETGRIKAERLVNEMIQDKLRLDGGSRACSRSRSPARQGWPEQGNRGRREPVRVWTPSPEPRQRQWAPPPPPRRRDDSRGRGAQLQQPPLERRRPAEHVSRRLPSPPPPPRLSRASSRSPRVARERSPLPRRAGHGQSRGAPVRPGTAYQDDARPPPWRRDRGTGALPALGDAPPRRGPASSGPPLRGR